MKTDNNVFICAACGKKIAGKDAVGTKNRNHCPHCLHSIHVDLNVAGDRLSECKSLMEPIGLTFKKSKSNELMLIHMCVKCHKVNINRLAGDDNTDQVIKVFEKSLRLDSQIKNLLHATGIDLLNTNNLGEIKVQLYGN